MTAFTALFSAIWLKPGFRKAWRVERMPQWHMRLIMGGRVKEQFWQLKIEWPMIIIIISICGMQDKGPKCCAVAYNAKRDTWSPYVLMFVKIRLNYTHSLIQQLRWTTQVGFTLDTPSCAKVNRNSMDIWSYALLDSGFSVVLNLPACCFSTSVTSSWVFFLFCSFWRTIYFSIPPGCSSTAVVMTGEQNRYFRTASGKSCQPQRTLELQNTDCRTSRGEWPPSSYAE